MELLGLGQRNSRCRLRCGGGFRCGRQERIIQIEGAVIIGNGSVGKIPVRHSLCNGFIGLFLLDLCLAGQRGQVTGPVIGSAQQLAQAAEIGQLFHAHDGHKEEAERCGVKHGRQNRQGYKILLGKPQRPCADCRQDAQHERRDAKAACKGPADRRQRNADRLAAVFPLALQAALPRGEAVRLFHAHGIARLLQRIGNAAQHGGADFAAHLDRIVDHIAKVVVIFVIVFVVWHGLSHLFVFIVCCRAAVRGLAAVSGHSAGAQFFISSAAQRTPSTAAVMMPPA